MKFLLAFALLLPIAASAHEEADFPGNKDKILAHLDERIAELQAHKTCISAASDKEAFKACHKGMKEKRHEHREEMKELRKDRREKRKRMNSQSLALCYFFKQIVGA